jgi:hypothetical protein
MIRGSRWRSTLEHHPPAPPRYVRYSAQSLLRERMLLIRDSGSSDTQGTASRLRGHCHASREAEPQMEHFTAQRQIEAHLRVNASVALSPSQEEGTGEEQRVAPGRTQAASVCSDDARWPANKAPHRACRVRACQVRALRSCPRCSGARDASAPASDGASLNASGVRLASALTPTLPRVRVPSARARSLARGVTAAVGAARALSRCGGRWPAAVAAAVLPCGLPAREADQAPAARFGRPAAAQQQRR